MTRSYYFGPGPASLPLDVLLEIQSETLNWHKTDLSILEIGHRSSMFQELLSELSLELRNILAIPNNYHLIFMGCPTRMHFNLIPMHFIKKEEQAGFWITGHWSRMAFAEAKNSHQAYKIPLELKNDKWQLKENTAYLYATINETLEGIRFDPLAKSSPYPLVADMTSCLTTEPLCVEDYAMLFAGAQKNLGCAGLSLVIIKADFLQNNKVSNLPNYLDYNTYVSTNSLCVTPPTFNCDVMLKVVKWIKAQGGVSYLAQENRKKAQALYAAIDASDFYYNEVPLAARSWVNVTFNLRDKAKEPDFFAQAKKAGLIGLEGHRVIGGVRASIYNAMPYQGVMHLIDFMMEYEKNVCKNTSNYY